MGPPCDPICHHSGVCGSCISSFILKLCPYGHVSLLSSSLYVIFCTSCVFPFLFPPHSTCTSSPGWCVCIKSPPPRLCQFVPCSPVVPSYVAHLCYFLSLFPSLPVSSCGVFLVLFLVFSLNLLLLCHFVLGTCFSFFWISFCLIKLALKS